MFASETQLEGDGGALEVDWIADFAFATVTLNGRGPRHFLVDTGASVVVIDPRVADDLGLDRVPVNPDDGGFPLTGAQATAKQVREVVPIRELRAGPLVLRDVDAVVVDSEFLGGIVGRTIDGVLPAAAFRDFVVTLDFPARTVTVGRGSLPAPGSDDAHVMPLLPNGLPQVRLDIGGTSFPVLLDTGSSDFLSVPEGVALPFRAAPVETGRHVTVGGVVPARHARISGQVSWAGHALEEPVVALDRGPRGSAGVALLRNFRVTLDMTHDRASFERTSGEPLRSPPVRSIGAGFVRAPDVWTVGYVIDGSPAARAGLAVGDRVDLVEGLPVGQMPRPVYETLVQGRGGIRFRVLTDGAPRDVVVAPVTFVE